MRIEICAALGTGKSTLAKAFARHAGWLLVEESVQDNPFVADFHANPARYSFENEVFFSADYIHKVKKTESLNTVFDSSAAVHKAYAALAEYPALEKNVVDTLGAVMEETLPPPDLLVHLKYPAEKILERIQGRSREFETDVTLGFVRQLQGEVARQVRKYAARHHVPVLNINMDKVDAKNNPADVAREWKRVERILKRKDIRP